MVSLAVAMSLISVVQAEDSISFDRITELPASISKNVKGKLKGGFSYADKKGKHILALARNASVMGDGADKIELEAVQYSNSGQDWNQEWTVKDFLICKDLDIDADFLVPLTSFSDLDSNGTAETTVAYQIACLGGIDPKPTKVIMREGANKYAIRGASLVKVNGAAPFGGEFKMDAALQSKRLYKDYLMRIWKKASGE
jgi:hypothetical protein